MPGKGEQRKAEVNVDEDHVTDCSENEEKDSCSEAGRTVDERCLEKKKGTKTETTKKKVRSFLKLFNSWTEVFNSWTEVRF